jgi:hypothetical protein
MLLLSSRQFPFERIFGRTAGPASISSWARFTNCRSVIVRRLRVNTRKGDAPKAQPELLAELRIDPVARAILSLVGYRTATRGSLNSIVVGGGLESRLAHSKHY